MASKGLEKPSVPYKKDRIMKAPVLVVIDIQKEYTTKGRSFYLESAGPSIENARRVLQHSRKMGWPIIHVRHLQNGEIFSPESEYSEFVSDFAPVKGEPVAIKRDYSSFSSPDFEKFLNQYRDRKILIIGYGSTMCCLSTVIDGYHRGYQLNFVSDASCAKSSKRYSEQDLHEHATDIISIYAAISKTSEIIPEA